MKQLLKDDARFANEQPYSLQLEKALQRSPTPAPLPDSFGARATVIGNFGKGPGRLPAARLPPRYSANGLGYKPPSANDVMVRC